MRPDFSRQSNDESKQKLGDLVLRSSASIIQNLYDPSAQDQDSGTASGVTVHLGGIHRRGSSVV